MGQRANLVIKRGGRWSLFYDHWCANTLDDELFWGPELAEEFIQSRDPLSDQDDWLDEVWCEGAAVLDFDSKVLLWFGGETVLWNLPIRRAYLALMRLQWQDWTTRWAQGAIQEVGEYLGLAAERFLAADRPEDQGHFQQIKDFPEDNDTLVSIRTATDLRVTRCHTDDASLEAGPGSLGRLLDLPQIQVSPWGEEFPQAGIHLDLVGREVHFWRVQPHCSALERVRQAWSGWGVHFFGDRIEDHLACLPGEVIELPFGTTRENQAMVLDALEKGVDRKARNPARELLPRLGAGAKVSPWTDEVRGSVGDPSFKRRLLDDLRQRIPVGSDASE